MREKMIADVIEQNGVLRISLDHKFAKYLGLKKGDRVFAWIEKIIDDLDNEDN